MLSPQQLTIWRKQAADRLLILINRTTGDEIQPGDYKIDDLLRSLTNLPARPSDREPFKGMFPNSPISAGRVQVANRLKQLIINLRESGAQDGWVDDLLRSLSNLPPRPSDRPPYAGIFAEAKIPKITVQQILEIAPYADATRVAELLPHLQLTMAGYQITTPLRQSHFLAQLAHESGSFSYLEEIDPGDYLEGRTDLGNTELGDGRRFKGRGLIQITGRTNYGTCGRDLGVDLIKNPARLSDNDLACLSAGWFWQKNQLNELADRNDVELITRTINGGLNGYADRQEFLAVAKEVLLA